MSANTMDNKIEQVKALNNGKGLQHLLNIGCEILGNPVYIHDTNYKLLAHAENIVTDDPLWNELVTTGIHHEKTIEFFKNEYFIDAVANVKTITFLTSNKLKYNRILGKILNGTNTTVACANVVACNKPFENNDPIIFETLCQKLSQEISKSEFYQAYGEVQQEAVIRELIEGRVEDKKLYTHHVAEIYKGLKNYLFIAIADISKSDFRHTRLVYFKNVFKQTQPMFKYAIYAGYIIIIISSDNVTLNVDQDFKQLKKVIEENNIYVGISSCFENLFESRKYYIEARSLLKYGLKSAGTRRIFLYSDNS